MYLVHSVCGWVEEWAVQREARRVGRQRDRENGGQSKQHVVRGSAQDSVEGTV